MSAVLNISLMPAAASRGEEEEVINKRLKREHAGDAAL